VPALNLEGVSLNKANNENFLHLLGKLSRRQNWLLGHDLSGTTQGWWKCLRVAWMTFSFDDRLKSETVVDDRKL